MLFQIEVNGNAKGLCSLRKSPGSILRIETLAMEKDVGWEVRNIVLSRLMNYAKTVNSSSIIVSTCSKELSQLLQRNGFETLYLDDVLYFDLDNEADYESELSKVELRRSNLKRLQIIYSTHMDVFSDNPVEQMYDPTSERSASLGIARALGAWALHVLIARLSTAVRLNSIAPLVQRRWDPIPLEIDEKSNLVGYSFLLRITPTVIELGIIGILKDRQGTGIGSIAVNSIKQYAKEIGARRLVTGSGPRGTGPFFKKCGFQLAFSEETLCLRLNKNS